jgi:hypothetical protein
MAEPRRMICSNCEYQAPMIEFGAADATVRCPKCGSDAIRFADFEPATYGGLTISQWELVRELTQRELRSGLIMTGQKEDLEAILAVAEEEALPAVAAIDEMGIFGFLEEATTVLAQAQEEGAAEAGLDDEWPDDAREELFAAIEEAPQPLRETLAELVDGLCEALSEREAALVASVAVAAGLGGELERDEDDGTGNHRHQGGNHNP